MANRWIGNHLPAPHVQPPSPRRQGTRGENYAFQTFKSVKIVNMQSTGTLPKQVLDVRIGHKFGDMAGECGGWKTFDGLENVADIYIGVSYGITDNIGRPYQRDIPLKQNMNGTF
jgi:hypothetical protein